MTITIDVKSAQSLNNKRFIKFLEFIKEYETRNQGQIIVWEELLGEVFRKYHNLFHEETSTTLLLKNTTELGHYTQQLIETKNRYLALEIQLEELKKKNKLK